MSDIRLYILTFNMKHKMNIYYKDNYKSWVDEGQIKIGETDNWTQRLKMYTSNYGTHYVHKHKNYPKCDGCLIDSSSLEKNHNHLEEIITWKVSLTTEERHKIEEIIRTEFDKYGRTKDYFDISDFRDIKERMNFLIESWHEVKKDYGF